MYSFKLFARIKLRLVFDSSDCSLPLAGRFQPQSKKESKMSEKEPENKVEGEASDAIMASEMLKSKRVDPRDLKDLGATFAHSNKEWQE